MQPFSVLVEFDTADVSPDTYEALFDALHDQHGAVGPAPNGNLSVRLTIEADSVAQAATRGIEYAQASAAQHDIPPNTVIGAEVVTEAERDRRLGDDEFGELSAEQEHGISNAPAYGVYVEFDTADAAPEVYEALFDVLLDQHGAVGPAPNGNLSVRLTIEADSVAQAATRGIEYAQTAASQHGITPDTVIGAEVVISRS
uniref:Uncharacterized protein n=1 Tax=Streptomyces sp. FR1 TaxID=349971 RepID=V9Z2R5_9ACTN|nr:hypothetical protein [Streptomyces sp. FR1]AHE38832.1 hypothetical protein pFRL3_55 [Streptomyces sp. FR1]